MSAVQHGDSNNISSGTTSITVPAGGGAPQENQLVILSIGVLDPPAGLTVTPPLSTNSWNLIDIHSAGTDYVQYIYWHAISGSETGSAPRFTFTFNFSVSATAVAVIYQNTCTQSESPCSTNNESPILDLTTGTETASESVSETSVINVQSGGVATCAFGTSNDEIGFEDAPTSPTMLNFQTGNDGTNAGLNLYDRRETTTTTDGPWQATLPEGATGDNVAQCVSVLPVGF